jgi:hypothetical protein
MQAVGGQTPIPDQTGFIHSTWSVVIDQGRDAKTGKRKRVWHSGFTTLSDAVEARTRLLRERDTGSAIDPSRQTFAEYLRDEWLPSREPVTRRAGRGIAAKSASRRGTPTAETSASCGTSRRGSCVRNRWQASA